MALCANRGGFAVAKIGRQPANGVTGARARWPRRGTWRDHEADVVGSGGALGQPPPPNPKRTHNYMFPVLFTTQNNTTQTDVLGSRPWPRGLFTLSARLVDGAGAGRCRMPRGRVRSGLWPVDGAGRGWGPLHPIRCAGSTGGCSSAVPSSSGCEVKSLQ